MIRPTAKREESGFTLVEVLVAIVIEAVIIGALGMAFTGILKSTASVNKSLSRSGDARIAAAYIISDARNSSGPEVSLTTATCIDASPPVAGGSLAVELRYNTTASLSGNTVSDVVDYMLASNQLMRRECKSGALVSDRVVASSVASVSVTCGSPTASCSASSTSITVQITETPDANGASYVYSLTGAFRKIIGDGPPAWTFPTQSVILLGSGSTCVNGATGLAMSTSAHITVYGTAVINNTNQGSCTAMNMTTSSTFTAGTTKILSPGTCSANTSAVCPTITSYSSTFTDPFSAIAAPSAAALGLTAKIGCPGGIAQPGVYAATLTVNVSNTCDLQPGVYILNAGISVTTSAHLTSSNGGVLLYIAGGTFDFSTSATIDISAQTTNAWAGIAIWQAKTDTNTLSFSTSGNITVDGYIYAPKAAVNMSTSAVNPSVKGIVAQNLIMTTSANLVIGTPPTITTSSPLSDGEKSVAYTATVVGIGGNSPYTWSATGLPAGLTINAGSGVISGTPTATGTSSAVVKLTEATGAFDTATLSLTVVAAPTISTASLPQADKTVAYSTTLAATPGEAPYSWSATGLPAGLTMSSAGVISGTPTGTAGTATVAVTLSDALGGTASKSLSLVVVNPPTITTASLPSGQVSAPYAGATMTGASGTTPYSWSATGLPAGLAMSSGGVISGTPTGAAGTATVVVTLTDAAGGTATKNLSLVVAAQPTITSITLTNKAGGTPGNMEAGDKITIVYSAAMRVSSFCTTWITGDAANQSLTGSNLLVNVANGASDVITVSNSGGCAFNLGSINLVSNAYVTTAASFGGAAGNTSIAWTASTRTLVITLGAVTGTTATVNATTSPVYAAPATLVNSAGASLGNSPFALTPAAVRF